MKSKRTISILLVFLMLFSVFPGVGFTISAKAETAVKKYVINIVWDGLSANLFNKLKSQGLETPNIDQLISNGTKLDNIKTTIPSYGAAQAALVTGAYPDTNGFLYRYYNKSTNLIIQDSTAAKVNGQTIFEAINSQKPDMKTLAIGIGAGTTSLDGRGVSTGDENHKLIAYSLGDKLVDFGTVGNDIINSINSPLGMADYILAYSNDIKMDYWGKNASDAATEEASVSVILTKLDAKLGDIINALKSKGVYDDTTIILNSLSSVYAVPKKITSIATDITSGTGVETLFGSTNSTTVKAVVVKAYIMKYAQLYFTDKATQEDKDKVLAYLNDDTTKAGQYIKEVVNPADVKASAAFADYLLNPVDDTTFSQASTGYGRTDNLDDMEQFFVVSGNGVVKNASVNAANIVDIVPNISFLLGISAPADNEGNLWDIFDLVPPEVQVTLDGQKDVNGYYNDKVTVTVSAADNLGIESIQYDTGDGYKNYAGRFEVNKDCQLKVKAIDKAGNVSERTENIEFSKVFRNVSFSGDYDIVNGSYYTNSNSLTLSGSVVIDDPNLSVTINGEPVTLNGNEFSKAIALNDGKNSVILEAMLYGVGNSQSYTIYKVYNPSITSIKDGDVVSDSLLNIEGYTVPGSSVKANDVQATIDDEGKFTAQFNLTEGENAITISSTVGKYANQTAIKVGYYLPVQIVITNITNKQIVKTNKITVEGTVDKVCSVKINGNPAALDKDNKFSGIVELQKGVNVVTVEANYNGVKSSKSVKVDYVDPNDNYVVYINWDGFARYYYDLANQGGTTKTPVLNELIGRGVFFENVSTGIPSITDAMQTAIVSGGYSSVTGNGYRYYDKTNKVVIQFGRDNKAETIAEAAVRQGLKIASVNQFALENRGTVAGDPNKPYISASGAYLERFDEAIKLIMGEPVASGPSQVELDEVPRFLAIYADDLDALGHNETPHYGIELAATEQERLDNVVTRLELMDAKLGEFIQACKDRGIYDNMSFVLTTDHGMAPFGQQGSEADAYGKSSLPDLVSTLQGLGYNVEVLGGGESPKPETDIVIVTVGLEAQLSFTGSNTEHDIDRIIKAVKNKVYVGQIMKKGEMKKRGVMDGFADLIVSPKSPYHFKVVSDPNKIYTVRGQHDSLDETAQDIFSVMWGKGVKEGYVYNKKIYNIDFARTMTKLLGIDGPKDATGAILTGALE